MAAATSFLNPIDFPNEWSFITIAGQRSPGVIPPNGIHGFDRETGWDKKKGKGAAGVTLSLVQQPPAEGSIEFQLWSGPQCDFWNDTFLPLLKYTPTKNPGSESAFDIYHPSLAQLGISSCVTHKASPILYAGAGLYVVRIDLIEWVTPPPVSIVATPKTSKTDDPKNTPGVPTDPIADAQQKQIEELLKKAQSP